MPGQGDFPLRSSWLGRGRGRGRGANPRKVVNVAALNSANAPVWINWTFNASGPFSQTLTANLFTNTQTFYAATVTRGTVNVSPALFTNSQTFYGPTVAQVTLLSPSLLTNTQTFYSPTATRLNTLAPALYTNTQTFFAPAVTTTRTLEASLFTNSQVFYGPTATAINPLLPSLFTNDQTFYSPTVAIVGAPQFIEPSLFVNTNIFYPPTVVDPPAQLVGGGGGEDSSRSKPTKTKRRKTGFANERAILEAALSDRAAKSADVLSDSNHAVAKKTAKTLNAYLNEKGTADALQSQLDRLLAQLSIKGANDQNNDSLNADLIAAADEIQQFLNDEQEAIQILLLDQENDDALLLMAMGF